MKNENYTITIKVTLDTTYITATGKPTYREMIGILETVKAGVILDSMSKPNTPPDSVETILTAGVDNVNFKCECKKK